MKGGPYDVWIFQVDGALALAASISIHLTGGANPRNIYWQTLGAVGLGANSNFAGTVLSNAAVGMGAGATMTGRLFSTTTVTLGAGSNLTQSTP